MASASPQALPRLERWLAGLPRGLGAYPEALAKGSLARNWHRGTRLEAADLADGGARLTLRFPPGLFDGLVLRAYAQAFEVALELSRAPAPAVHLGEEAPGRASFLACW